MTLGFLPLFMEKMVRFDDSISVVFSVSAAVPAPQQLTQTKMWNYDILHIIVVLCPCHCFYYNAQTTIFTFLECNVGFTAYPLCIMIHSYSLYLCKFTMCLSRKGMSYLIYHHHIIRQNVTVSRNVYIVLEDYNLPTRTIKLAKCHVFYLIHLFSCKAALKQCNIV